MRLIVQRVTKAKVSVESKTVGAIEKGYFVLVGLKNGDTKEIADLLAEKLVKLRIMADEQGKMNLSVKDSGGKMLLVSQFTLYGDTKGGNRPSFIQAMRPDEAEPLYNHFVEKVRSLGVSVETGKFGAYMDIEAAIDGPTTIVMEG